MIIHLERQEETESRKMKTCRDGKNIRHFFPLFASLREMLSKVSQHAMRENASNLFRKE